MTADQVYAIATKWAQDLATMTSQEASATFQMANSINQLEKANAPKG